MLNNPYQTPSDCSSTAEEPQKQFPKFQRFDLVWPLAFSANLIVPLSFAGGLTASAGKAGMAAAIFMLLGLGWFLGRRLPALRRRLLTGAWLVALSQLFPLLQIISGLIGLEITVLLGGAFKATDEDPLGSITSEIGGFSCTTVTGMALAAIAFVSGWIITAIYSGIENQLSPASTKPVRPDQI